jgi:hypothetical protein
MTDQTTFQTAKKDESSMKNEKSIQKQNSEQELEHKQKLLRLKTGYDQHASLFLRQTAPFLNVLIEMEKDAKSKYTIHFTYKALSLLAKHCKLEDPEQIKTFIARMNVSSGYKRNLCLAYNKYCKYFKISWNMPTYHPESKRIKIPTKEKIEMLIAQRAQTLIILKQKA